VVSQSKISDSNCIYDDLCCLEMNRLLTDLFSNPAIIKVGWAFGNSDIQMLRQAASGDRFALLCYDGFYV
jgi:hypothetical protein